MKDKMVFFLVVSQSVSSFKFLPKKIVVCFNIKSFKL